MNCIHNLRVLFSLILNNFFMNLIVCVYSYTIVILTSESLKIINIIS